jgi:hypothetical protein
MYVPVLYLSHLPNRYLPFSSHQWPILCSDSSTSEPNMLSPMPYDAVDLSRWFGIPNSTLLYVC